MIKTMPMQPDLFVWSALLGACRNHGNTDLAAELEPENTGNGLLPSSLYVNGGSWEKCCKKEEDDKEEEADKVSRQQLGKYCLIIKPDLDIYIILFFFLSSLLL